MANERELLFGLLALRDEYVTSSQLVAAFSEWLVERGRPLAEVLAAKAGIAAEDVADLQKQVERRVRLNGGDVAKSLHGLPLAEEVRRELDGLGDRQFSVDLAAVPGMARPQRAEQPPSEDSLATVAQGSLEEQLLIGGRYRVLRPHAAGGLGLVSVARDARLPREVAFKEIKPGRATDGAAAGQFVCEAEVTGALEHPGIPPVYDLGKYADGRPFYAMRFIRGTSLESELKRFHTLEEGQSTSVKWDGAKLVEMRKLLSKFVSVCEAIQYAHDRGVIHRDLKPDNIMLGRYGETLVVDWGLAKIVGSATRRVSEGEREPGPGQQGDEDHRSAAAWRASASANEEEVLSADMLSGESTETQAGHVKGTPAYMSPEQAAGNVQAIGRGSDVYALGAVLCSILTGKPPVSGNMVAVLERVREGRIDWPRAVDPQVPRGLDAIVRRGMERDPAARYASATALAKDVEQWLADEPVSVVPETLSTRGARVVRKHRGLVLTGLAASVVIGVGLAGGLLRESYLKGELEEANGKLTAALTNEQRATRLAEENALLSEWGEFQAERAIDAANKVSAAFVAYADWTNKHAIPLAHSTGKLTNAGLSEYMMIKEQFKAVKGALANHLDYFLFLASAADNQSAAPNFFGD